MAKKITVIGGSGFVGTNLCRQLALKQQDFEIIDLKMSKKFPEKTKKKEFFVQVNTGKELSKSGVYPEEIKKFLEKCDFYGIKNILGLMCIPPIEDDPKYHFNKLQNLAQENSISNLSIGMSGDYKEALPFKPTYIRLGTILFGKRN